MSSALAEEIIPRPATETNHFDEQPPYRVEKLTPVQCADWDRYVKVHPDGTLFHTIAWRDAVQSGFAHKAIYLTAQRGERLVGVLPLFLIASRLAGRMLVSVPYGVGGGILADDGEAIHVLSAAAKEQAHHHGCRCIAFRSENAVLAEWPTIDRYVGFRRELPGTAGEVLGWLPRKARAAARNARNKYRLTVSFGDEHLHEVWRLYTVSMKRLASLNYPFLFFASLIETTPGRHWVSLVRWRGCPVAGLVTFLFKDRVMPYFFGATRQARQCSAANLIYLTAMERAVENGYRVFDFGRSRRDNRGSFDFKRFQGFSPRVLGYQSYVPPGETPPRLSPGDTRYRLARRVWKHLPLWATQRLGARLSRHIPG